jgi:hypothetical protein
MWNDLNWLKIIGGFSLVYLRSTNDSTSVYRVSFEMSVDSQLFEKLRIVTEASPPFWLHKNQVNRFIILTDFYRINFSFSPIYIFVSLWASFCEVMQYKFYVLYVPRDSYYAYYVNNDYISWMLFYSNERCKIVSCFLMRVKILNIWRNSLNNNTSQISCKLMFHIWVSCVMWYGYINFVLWHVDPLLRNDHKISDNTTAVAR